MSKNSNINSGSKLHLRKIKEIYLKDGKKMIKWGSSRDSVCNSGINIQSSIYMINSFLKAKKSNPEMVCKRCCKGLQLKIEEFNNITN